MPDKSTIDLAVGRALNRLRTERGLTVTALANAAGVSPAMVSRVENAQVSPSLATLAALAGALAVPVMALLTTSDPVADIHHVRAGGGLPTRRVTPNHTHDYLLLGKHAGPGGSFQAARIRIDAGDAGDLPSYQHEGHVFLYILEGRARYHCGGETFDLGPGDTLSFDAKAPHGFTRIESAGVEFLTVSTRPD
jgi:transcriptional regulator with XRE-family HTH domain